MQSSYILGFVSVFFFVFVCLFVLFCFVLLAPPSLPTPYFFTYHVIYFLFRFYTICLSLDCSDDVDMTESEPYHQNNLDLCLLIA